MSQIEIVVLAAGLGTRMKSDLPKVLHTVCETPMILLLLRELERAVASQNKLSAQFNVVVGHGREQVMKTIRDAGLKTPVEFTVQEKQLGTGHAVKLALEKKSKASLVAVFNGDLPLFSAESFSEFLSAHQKTKSAASLASATLADAGQYGRILRKSKNFLGCVEFKDANAAQRKIKEYNGGVYLFDRALLQLALNKMSNKNAAGEFYLPDVFAFARKQKKRIWAHHYNDAVVLTGVNNMKELAAAQKLLYLQTAEKLMEQGVFLADPATTAIAPSVRFGRGCRVGACTSIHGQSEIADGVIVGSQCDLRDVKIGSLTNVKNSVVAAQTVMGKECTVGPMAQFRPGSVLKDHVKVGNFVEIKESEIGSHTSISHLSYVGDATVGSNVNIGCGFVTCNYDGLTRQGRRKHRSVIGDNVFIGSDCQVVAPIEIASGTFIASGSTVTESVSDIDSFVIARERQVTKRGYAKKYKSKK